MNTNESKYAHRQSAPLFRWDLDSHGDILILGEDGRWVGKNFKHRFANGVNSPSVQLSTPWTHTPSWRPTRPPCKYDADLMGKVLVSNGVYLEIVDHFTVVAEEYWTHTPIWLNKGSLAASQERGRKFTRIDKLIKEANDIRAELGMEPLRVV
jgi:hypothetical protein